MSEEKEDLLSQVRARVPEAVKPKLETAAVSRGQSGPDDKEPRPARASSNLPSPVQSSRVPVPSNGSSGPLYVGIDLGTSRSAICASNGKRATAPTVVGWPKDPISRQFLDQDIVFGEEAVKNRLSLEICYPLDGGVIALDGELKSGNGSSLPRVKAGNGSRAREAAGAILKHLLEQVAAQPGQKVHATVGTPGEISSHHRQALKEAAASVFDQVHITMEPFAVAYSLDALEHVLIVDIGAGTVDLCRVHGSIPGPEDTLTLTEAGAHIDQTLFNLLKQKYEKAQFSLGQVQGCKERSASVLPSTEPIHAVFPVNGSPTRHDIGDEIRRACQSIVEPIGRAIMRLVGNYDPEFQEDLKSHIWLAGGGSLITGLPQAIETAIGSLGPSVQVRRVEDPVYAGADGALRLAQAMPVEHWEVLE